MKFLFKKNMTNKCTFCLKNTNPDFKEAEVLRKYLSQRGRILPRERSGVCAAHQRKLASEIKRARILGLLPFVVYET